jgi:hypothetical protein
MMKDEDIKHYRKRLSLKRKEEQRKLNEYAYAYSLLSKQLGCNGGTLSDMVESLIDEINIRSMNI